jgi:hypothetical protein
LRNTELFLENPVDATGFFCGLTELRNLDPEGFHPSGREKYNSRVRGRSGVVPQAVQERSTRPTAASGGEEGTPSKKKEDSV